MKGLLFFMVWAFAAGLPHSSVLAQLRPADSLSTVQTINLFNNLRRLSGKYILFGHQDDLAYGVGWKDIEGRSDIKDVTGEYPALYGWDLGGIEKNNDPAYAGGFELAKLRAFIQTGYERGGIITLSWHLDNPVNGKNAWDTSHGTVLHILPGGSAHHIYCVWLDQVAAFLKSLKGPHGVMIPVIFRPFHELTGNWFWWGRNTCTPEEFIVLWRFTIDYLKRKGVHNVLYAYNTSSFTDKKDFLERYPGDAYVDVVSFDDYQYSDPEKDDHFVKNLKHEVALLDEIANEKGKISALAETGYEAIPYPKWWTNVLSTAIINSHLAYVLVWRNAGYVPEMKKWHFFAPFRGQVSEQDFLRFYENEKMAFSKKAEALRLYNTSF